MSLDAAAESSAVRTVDISKWLVGPALVFWLAAALLFSTGRYFNQDEFESMHQGWLLYSGKLQFLDFNSNHPPLFFELLGRLNAFIEDPGRLMRAGRILTLVSAAMQLALVGAIARRTSGARAGRWAVILYSTCVTFIEWSIEIRPDALMVPLWLASVYLLLTGTRLRTSARLFGIGLLLGTAFWVNQKAALLAVPMLVLLFRGGAGREWRFRETGWAVLGALLPTAICLGAASSAGNLDELVLHNFVGAAELAASDPYREFRTMVMGDLAARDTGLFFIAVFALTWFVRHWKELPARERYVLCAAVWGAGTFLLTPGPFHYYMLSVVPMFVVLGGSLLAKWDGWTARRRWTIACGLLLLCAPVARILRFTTPTNAFQLEAMRVGSALSAPESPVFDGAGFLVRRPDAYGFHWVLWIPELAKYRRGELPAIVPTVRAGGARLVMLSYRLESLPAKDLAALLRQFPRLWGPFCVPGFDSGSTARGGAEPIEFELWYDGDYEVAPAGSWIDGRPVGSGELVSLKAGIHQARLPQGEGRLVVRNAEYRSKVKLPPVPGDWRVLGRYGYRF